MIITSSTNIYLTKWQSPSITHVKWSDQSMNGKNILGQYRKANNFSSPTLNHHMTTSPPCPPRPPHTCHPLSSALLPQLPLQPSCHLPPPCRHPRLIQYAICNMQYTICNIQACVPYICKGLFCCITCTLHCHINTIFNWIVCLIVALVTNIAWVAPISC